MRKGFTLIELSIVLVIIGLITGGVVVGKDLIETSKLRATVSQYEKFNTAVVTFKLKYSGLAGDISNAAQFGFDKSYQTSYVRLDNGILEAENGASQFSQGIPGYETTQFWNHLSEAGLIENDIISNVGHIGVVPLESIPTILPPAKIGNNNFWMVFSQSGQNYYSLFGLSQLNYHYGTVSNNMTPAQAFYIDHKVDDGMPRAGKVHALYANGTYLINIIPGGNTLCMTGALGPTTTTYNVSYTTPICGLRFVLPF